MSIKNFFDGGKQISDSAGLPLNGGKCNFYEPGTTTLKTTYTTSAISVANANPVVLDSAGRANIWLNGNYRVIVKDSTGATTIYDEDNINPETASSLTAISTDTTLVLGDKGKFIQASGSITVTLTSAATLGAGWYIYIRNNGSNDVTITGANTGNTFNGTAFTSATFILYVGESRLIVVNSAADGFITFTKHNLFKDSIVFEGATDNAFETSLTVEEPATSDKTVTIPNRTGTIQLNTTPGQIIQTVVTQTGAVATGTTTTPYDDTIPQITEGTLFLTQAITPTSATNILIFEIDVMIYSATAGQITLALHQDAIANALAATCFFANGGSFTYNFRYKMVSGTTSATTFTVRLGPDPGLGGTITLNGDAGTRRYGGVANSSITITEIAA